MARQGINRIRYKQEYYTKQFIGTVTFTQAPITPISPPVPNNPQPSMIPLSEAVEQKYVSNRYAPNNNVGSNAMVIKKPSVINTVLTDLFCNAFAQETNICRALTAKITGATLGHEYSTTLSAK